MLRLLSLLFLICMGVPGRCGTSIMGEREVSASGMADFVLARNPDFDPEIAYAFADLGDLYGIRGDVALCQAVCETGWFRYANSGVTEESHNYCGLGVTRRGEAGCSFPTVADGVRAMLQHLYAYATTAPLPGAEEVIDPRFGHVSRGCAPMWEDLSGRWAVNPGYANAILDLYARMLKAEVKE